MRIKYALLALALVFTFGFLQGQAVFAQGTVPSQSSQSQDPPKERGADDKPPIAKGTVKGKVDQVGSNYVVVVSVSGAKERYMPVWKGGRTGGPDKAILKLFSELKAGDSVEIDWFVNDHVRIENMRITQKVPR